MSVKIPGVGKSLEKFEYTVNKDNKNAVSVNIMGVNPGTIPKPVQRTYEVRTDTRRPDSDVIVSAIKGVLAAGLAGKKVKVREDKERDYLWFDDDQFTGNRV